VFKEGKLAVYVREKGSTSNIERRMEDLQSDLKPATEDVIRSSSEQIRDMRARRSSGMLVTGATGFLGSHLAVDLLRKGYRVLLLVRPLKNLSAGERAERLLNWFETDEIDLANLRVIQGNLEDPLLGLDPQTYDEVASDVDEIIPRSFIALRRLPSLKGSVLWSRSPMWRTSGTSWHLQHGVVVLSSTMSARRMRPGNGRVAALKK
jgi:NAD(P)-dependent dehydrogenase (short-subunit alcohol dehydrogenase family)